MPRNNMDDNRNLIEFWNKAYGLSDEDKNKIAQDGADGWRSMAPSEKLFLAATSLGKCKKVLDYGCGDAWGAIIASKSGCTDVTAVDVSDGPLCAASFYSSLYQADVNIMKVSPSWMSSVPAGTFDGLICSNVLDVVPHETAANIIGELARVCMEGAIVKIGLNFHLSEEAATARGMVLVDGRKLYVNDVLRLVPLSDDEWTAMLGRHFKVQKLEHFAWPGEKSETRRLFHLTR